MTTADHMLRTLISPRLGIHFSVEPSEDESGFTINVFSLQAAAVTAAGVTLPANPNTVVVEAGQTPGNLYTHVVTSNDHLVNLIRVIGKRIVVACTIAGPSNPYADPWVGMLDAAWDSGLEADYNAGTGPSPTDAPGLSFSGGLGRAGGLRAAAARFRDVYQLYLMPASVDLQAISAAVMVTTAAGDVSTGTTGSDEPPRQLVLRHTLHWIPFRADYDYSAWPPTQLTLDCDPDYAPQYLQPQVYLYDDVDQWRPAHMAGVHVEIPRHGLGVRLVSHPRHLLGKGTFPAGVDDPPSAPLGRQGRYRHRGF